MPILSGGRIFLLNDKVMALKHAIAGAGLILLLQYGPAHGFPDGAPWGMDVADGCVMCHFDGEPETDTTALTLTGLPDILKAGELYALTVSLTAPDMAASGMMISAWLNGRPIGTMQAPDNRGEAKDNKARSANAPAPWHIAWQAPHLDKSGAGEIEIVVWANAANGDGSPFGDRIFKRQITRRIVPDSAADTGVNRP